MVMSWSPEIQDLLSFHYRLPAYDFHTQGCFIAQDGCWYFGYYMHTSSWKKKRKQKGKRIRAPSQLASSKNVSGNSS